MNAGKLIYGFRDSNKYVYHYTKSCTAIDKILPAKKLMANSYFQTNDPKEQKQWVFDFYTNKSLDPIEHRLAELSSQFSDALKAKTKVMCFSQDRADLTGNHLEDVCKRGFAKPRMWEQYGDAHQGICLVFDRQALDQSIENAVAGQSSCIAQNVIYQDRPFIDDFRDGNYKIEYETYERLGLKRYAALHVKRFHQRLFFEKMTDWSQESEFRWVIFHDSDEPLLIDYQDSLAGIVFGQHTSDQDIEEIIKLAGADVMYTALTWENCFVWYDFASPKYG